MYKYLFGPVSSRRLGVSLGVDLVPSKTCSMDCVYCEAGHTTSLTLDRKEFFPTDEIIRELDEFLSEKPKLDYITFSGAGEPTLHSGIGRIVGFIKKKYPEYSLCLITNGTLLGDAKLAKELESVDLVIPSLDAADENTFRKINRPFGSLSCSSHINSLESFRKHFKASLWLEIFVVPGLNDSPESVDAILKAIERIKPDKVQLNSLDRPGSEKWVRKAGEGEFLQFVKALEPVVKVEIIGKTSCPGKEMNAKELQVPEVEERILELVRRRPCTLPEICTALGHEEDSIRKVLDGMSVAGMIRTEKMQRGVFYKT